MTITSEKIREIQNEIDVTYEEAESYLRRARGDVDFAIHLLKIKKDSRFNHFYEEAVRIFKEFMVYRLIIKKEEEVFINIPLLLVIVMFWVIDWGNTLFILIVATGFVLMTNSEISLKRVEAKASMDTKESKKGQEPKEPMPEAKQESETKSGTNEYDNKGQAPQSGETKTDDYNEIIIDK